MKFIYFVLPLFVIACTPSPEPTPTPAPKQGITFISEAQANGPQEPTTQLEKRGFVRMKSTAEIEADAAKGKAEAKKAKADVKAEVKEEKQEYKATKDKDNSKAVKGKKSTKQCRTKTKG